MRQCPGEMELWAHSDSRSLQEEIGKTETRWGHSNFSCVLTGNMGEKLPEPRLCFLLLLELVINGCLIPDPAKFNAFLEVWTHISNRNNLWYNTAKQVVNRLERWYKKKSTFLRTRFVDIVHVCGNINVACSKRTRTKTITQNVNTQQHGQWSSTELLVTIELYRTIQPI